MKKLMISAALAASLAVPAVAQQASAEADPFLATQGLETTGLAIVGGMTVLVVIAAAANEDDSSSSTSTAD